MAENKTIKINFCDFQNGYDKGKNPYIDILGKYYKVELSETPDFLFYSCFGVERLKYNNCIKIFLPGEKRSAKF